VIVAKKKYLYVPKGRGGFFDNKRIFRYFRHPSWNLPPERWDPPKAYWLPITYFVEAP